MFLHVTNCPLKKCQNILDFRKYNAEIFFRFFGHIQEKKERIFYSPRPENPYLHRLCWAKPYFHVRSRPRPSATGPILKRSTQPE